MTFAEQATKILEDRKSYLDEGEDGVIRWHEERDLPLEEMCDFGIEMAADIAARINPGLAYAVQEFLAAFLIGVGIGYELRGQREEQDDVEQDAV
jgi:hypothetical protein